MNFQKPQTLTCGKKNMCVSYVENNLYSLNPYEMLILPIIGT